MILGGSGQLGTALRAHLAERYTLLAPSSQELPLTDPAAIRHAILSGRPIVVINAAAYTKVDEAEVQQELAFAVNGAAPAAMAEASTEIGSRFVHVSTDYVFDGMGVMPYVSDAPTHPLNVYGASKRAGEVAVLTANPNATILRTAWVHAGTGTNFVGTAVRLLSAGRAMKVVDDQVGTPTRTSTIGDAILRVIDRPHVVGLQHVTDAGVASWYDVACCVLDTLREEGRAPQGASVSPVDSSVFPRSAVRPKVSVLDTHSTRAALEWTPPHWRDGVIASTREWLRSS